MTKYDNDPISDSHDAPYLKLFTSATGNGRKVTILLELLKIPYVYRELDYKTDTKEQWFLELNAHGKIPLLSDVDSKAEVFNLAESGAILQYVAQKFDTEHRFSYEVNSKLHWEEVQFLFFHSSGLSVAQFKYRQTKTDEAKKALLDSYRLVDAQLARNGTGYLVGDHISLADIIALAHADQFYKAIDEESVEELKHLKKWYDALISLPEVETAFGKTG